MTSRTYPWCGGWAGLALLALAALAATGCSGRNPVDSMIAGLTPPSPHEVAGKMFSLDPDERRNSVALISAAKWGGGEAYLKAYRMLIDDPDATVRAAAAKALGLHGAVEDAKLLVRRMVDSSAPVRWECALGLQRIHNPAAAKPLMTAMAKDEDPDVRMAAAYALGQYAEQPVFQALVGALEDSDYGVVQAAQQSLNCLTGEAFGGDGALWMLWAEKHPGEIFKNRQQYTWQPYVKPLHWWEKAQFWRDHAPAPPRPPTGMEVESSAGK